MRKMFLVIFLCFQFPLFGAEIGALVAAGAAAKFVGQNCCIPFCLWCTGKIHDTLDQGGEKDYSHSHIDKHPPLKKNIYQEPNNTPLVTEQGDHYHFEQEIFKLMTQHISITDVTIGSLIHIFIFDDKDKILPIFSIPGDFSSEEYAQNFNFLIENYHFSEKKYKSDKKFLHNIVRIFNATITENFHPHHIGLYHFNSGRAFYKIGTTHFLPLREDEIPGNSGHHKKVLKQKPDEAIKTIEGIIEDRLSKFNKTYDFSPIDHPNYFCCWWW